MHLLSSALFCTDRPSRNLSSLLAEHGVVVLGDTRIIIITYLHTSVRLRLS